MIIKRNIVVAVTGASGVVYATRLLEVLHAAGGDIPLMISPAAQTVFKQEWISRSIWRTSRSRCDVGHRLEAQGSQVAGPAALSGISSGESNVLAVGSGEENRLIDYHYRDYMGAIASGSILTNGMVICPCSSGTRTRSSTARANLIHRTAEVHFKERRK